MRIKSYICILWGHRHAITLKRHELQKFCTNLQASPALGSFIHRSFDSDCKERSWCGILFDGMIHLTHKIQMWLTTDIYLSNMKLPQHKFTSVSQFWHTIFYA